MLEMLRRNSRNAIIYVLFGVIIAVFIINFGPGSRGCTPGAGATVYAAKVSGVTLTEQDFRFTYLAVTNGQVPAQVAQDRRFELESALKANAASQAEVKSALERLPQINV